MGTVHIGLNAEYSRSSDKPFESEPTAWPRRRRLVCMTIALLGLAVSGMADSVVAAENDFVSLFNGRDLDDWDGAPGFWRVEDGTIVGETTTERQLAHHSYLLWRGGKVGDFELRLSFRLTSGNSGVQYRSRDLGDHDLAGYQCNMQTAKPGQTAILEEMKNGRGGALVEAGQRVLLAPDGDCSVLGRVGKPDEIESTIDQRGWNQLTIIAQGDRLIHKLNGRVVVDVTDRQVDKASERGIIALQLHTGKPMKVQFKDIRMKRILITLHRNS